MALRGAGVRPRGQTRLDGWIKHLVAPRPPTPRPRRRPHGVPFRKRQNQQSRVGAPVTVRTWLPTPLAIYDISSAPAQQGRGLLLHEVIAAPQRRSTQRILLAGLGRDAEGLLRQAFFFVITISSRSQSIGTTLIHSRHVQAKGQSSSTQGTQKKPNARLSRDELSRGRRVAATCCGGRAWLPDDEADGTTL